MTDKTNAKAKEKRMKLVSYTLRSRTLFGQWTIPGDDDRLSKDEVAEVKGTAAYLNSTDIEDVMLSKVEVI